MKILAGNKLLKINKEMKQQIWGRVKLGKKRGGYYYTLLYWKIRKLCTYAKYQYYKLYFND